MNKRYIKLLQSRIGETAIGRSTLRNQGAPGVVASARWYLKRIQLKKFNVKTSAKYKKVLDRYTLYLKRKLPVGAQNWGTARKALNVFLRDVIYNRYLCDYYHLASLEPWLEVPLDSYVAKGLLNDRPNGLELPTWRSIKKLTKKISQKYQKAAKLVATKEGVVPIHLDLKYWRS